MGALLPVSSKETQAPRGGWRGRGPASWLPAQGPSPWGCWGHPGEKPWHQPRPWRPPPPPPLTPDMSCGCPQTPRDSPRKWVACSCGEEPGAADGGSTACQSPQPTSARGWPVRTPLPCGAGRRWWPLAGEGLPEPTHWRRFLLISVTAAGGLVPTLRVTLNLAPEKPWQPTARSVLFLGAIL